MVDDYYCQYTTELRRDVSGKGILLDTRALATSIASTAAGANELKTVLSAISSSVQGLSKSIDANVLLGNTLRARTISKPPEILRKLKVRFGSKTIRDVRFRVG